jgi:ferredoxin/flavodoxin
LKLDEAKLDNSRTRFAKIAYFSGTGGTKRIAECTSLELRKCDYEVDLERIGPRAIHDDAFERYDLLILISVVHEFNFPYQVRSWVSTLDRLKYPSVAVFSVSGGGRALGNRGAQRKVIEMLESQGIPVTFDETFVMPSNFFYRVKHPVDAMEMTAYPAMVKRAVTKLLTGELQRPKTPLFDQIVTRLFRDSWKHTHRFGSAITVSENCTACGVCVHVCPVDNIELSDEANHPDFGETCVFCLGCLYACPTSALQPGRERYAVLKDGYDLKEIEQRHYDCAEWEHIETLCKGYSYSGIKMYLLEARTLLFPD